MVAYVIEQSHIVVRVPYLHLMLSKSELMLNLKRKILIELYYFYTMAELNNLAYINARYSMFVLRKYLSGKNKRI